MKTLKYIWRNVTRNKLRSGLTVLSIGFSLALMTVLYGYMAMQQVWGHEAAKHHRLVVMNIQGFSGEIPIAYVDRVRQMKGIDAAVPYSWYGGDYQDTQLPFAQFGTDPDHVFDVWDEFVIDPQQLEDWQGDRRGCVVDRRLAEKYGWQIGDRVPLKGVFFPVDLDLKLCGVFDAPVYTDSLWFHWKYLDEGLQDNSRGTGNAGTVFAKVSQDASIAPVCQAIDDRFASSQYPTRSQTEEAFSQMFADMLGNIQAYIRNIGLAVVFSLSLVAGNTMAMSMRERTTEIAVLKAIGFSRGRVLWMILGEACAIALCGGVLGIALGCFCLQMMHGVSSQFIPLPLQEILGWWLVMLFGVAAAIGLVSGVVPAVQASQRSVIDGLRHVV